MYKIRNSDHRLPRHTVTCREPSISKTTTKLAEALGTRKNFPFSFNLPFYKSKTKSLKIVFLYEFI